MAARMGPVRLAALSSCRGCCSRVWSPSLLSLQGPPGQQQWVGLRRRPLAVLLRAAPPAAAPRRELVLVPGLLWSRPPLFPGSYRRMPRLWVGAQHAFHASPPLCSSMNPYQVLGVDKAASTKDIKMAYYKLAKQFHPDLNPNDEFAKKKFQEVSEAFDILKDDRKRREYDQTSSSSSYWSQDPGQNQHNQQRAQQQWQDVTDDADIINEALNEYMEQLAEDGDAAALGMWNLDFQPFGVFVSRHGGFFVAVLLPIFVIVRYPAAVLAFTRFGAAIFFRIVVLTGGRGVFRMIWSALVASRRSLASAAQEYTRLRRVEKASRGSSSSTRNSSSSRSHHQRQAGRGKGNNGSSSSSSSSRTSSSSKGPGRGGGGGRRSRHF